MSVPTVSPKIFKRITYHRLDQKVALCPIISFQRAGGEDNRGWKGRTMGIQVSMILFHHGTFVQRNELPKRIIIQLGQPRFIRTNDRSC